MRPRVQDGIRAVRGGVGGASSGSSSGCEGARGGVGVRTRTTTTCAACTICLRHPAIHTQGFSSVKMHTRLHGDDVASVHLDLTLRTTRRLAHLSRPARARPEALPRAADAPFRHPDRHAAGSAAAPSSRAASRSSCVSEFEPAGDQPTAIAELVEGVLGGRAQPGAARRHRHRQDLHRRQDHRGDAAPGDHPRPEQDAGRAALRRVQGRSSRRTRSSTSSPTTTTTSRRPTSRAPTPTSRRNSQINDQIDRMRHSATRALLERDDVIIVASVSCIYGIGSAETYGAMTQDLVAGQQLPAAAGDRRPRRPSSTAATTPAFHPRQLPRPRRLARDLAGAPRGSGLAALLLRRGARSRSPSSTR